MITLTLRLCCKEHPRYRGLRRPRVPDNDGCLCWTIYRLRKDPTEEMRVHLDEDTVVWAAVRGKD
jgi:hypothetical protein